MKIKYNLKKILIEKDELDFEETFYSKYDEVPEWTPHDWDPGNQSPEDPFEIQSNEWHKYQEDLNKYIRKTLYHHIENEPNAIHPQLTKNDSYTGDKIDWVDDFVEILDEPSPVFPESPGYAPDKNHTGIMIKNDHITNSRAQTWIDMFDNFYGPGTTKDKFQKWRSGDVTDHRGREQFSDG